MWEKDVQKDFCITVFKDLWSLRENTMKPLDLHLVKINKLKTEKLMFKQTPQICCLLLILTTDIKYC